MTQKEFRQAIRRTTGESEAVIERLGFQPLRRTPFERDPESYSVDWDELEAERNTPVYSPRTRSFAAA